MLQGNGGAVPTQKSLPSAPSLKPSLRGLGDPQSTPEPRPPSLPVSSSVPLPLHSAPFLSPLLFILPFSFSPPSSFSPTFTNQNTVGSPGEAFVGAQQSLDGRPLGYLLSGVTSDLCLYHRAMDSSWSLQLPCGASALPGPHPSPSYSSQSPSRPDSLENYPSGLSSVFPPFPSQFWLVLSYFLPSEAAKESPLSPNPLWTGLQQGHTQHLGAPGSYLRDIQGVSRVVSDEA